MLSLLGGDPVLHQRQVHKGGGKVNHHQLTVQLRYRARDSKLFRTSLYSLKLCVPCRQIAVFIVILGFLSLSQGEL